MPTPARRARLTRAQDGKCYYCGRETSYKTKNLHPIVEHSIPRHRGGRAGQNLVLACSWCDRTKGMITGPEFIALIREECFGREFNQAMTDIARRAKALNKALHVEYQNSLRVPAPDPGGQ